MPVTFYYSPEGTPATGSTGPAPSATTAPASSSGTTGTPAGQSATPTQQGAPSSFYSYKFDDGKEHTFSSKQELDSFFRSGVLRHSDYTKKTQELAEQRKSLEAERKRMQEQVDRLTSLQNKWEPVDKFFSSRPDLAKEIITKYKGVKPQTEAGDSELRKQFEEFKKSIEEKDKKAADEDRRRQVYSAMKERYEDFDEEGVNKALASMVEGAPGDEMATLIELIHFANKGRMAPAEIERKMAQNLQHKNALKPPLKSGATPAEAPKQYKTTDEALEAAKRAIGV